MHGRGVSGFVMKAAYDSDVTAKGFERLEYARELETGPFSLGRPLVHNGAMREINESQARRGLWAGTQRGDHRV
jgi:hypothetical protein